MIQGRLIGCAPNYLTTSFSDTDVAAARNCLAVTDDYDDDDEDDDEHSGDRVALGGDSNASSPGYCQRRRRPVDTSGGGGGAQAARTSGGALCGRERAQAAARPSFGSSRGRSRSSNSLRRSSVIIFSGGSNSDENVNADTEQVGAATTNEMDLAGGRAHESQEAAAAPMQPLDNEIQLAAAGSGLLAPPRPSASGQTDAEMSLALAGDAGGDLDEKMPSAATLDTAAKSCGVAAKR